MFRSVKVCEGTSLFFTSAIALLPLWDFQSHLELPRLNVSHNLVET